MQVFQYHSIRKSDNRFVLLVSFSKIKAGFFPLFIHKKSDEFLLSGSCYGQAKGCGNTGKISVTNQGGKTSRAVVKVCGIEAAAVKIKQCYNIYRESVIGMSFVRGLKCSRIT